MINKDLIKTKLILAITRNKEEVFSMSSEA